MRYTLVRIWAALTIALLAGVLGDAGTEFSAIFGWLGGTARDLNQQGILPALLVTFALALGLCGYVVCSRIAPGDPLVRRLDDVRARAIDAAVAFAGSWVTVVAVEGYETRFGGAAPFDLNSVVVAHAPVLVAAFLIVAVAARMMLRRGDPLRRAWWCVGRGARLVVLADLALASADAQARRNAASRCALLARRVRNRYLARASRSAAHAPSSSLTHQKANRGARLVTRRLGASFMRKTGRSLCVLAVLALSLQHADAAELVTGAILGTVSTTARAPIAGARIVATAPSGRYAGTTDASGRFTILGVAPDTYAVSVEANGFEPANATVVVLPGAHERLAVVLLAKLKEIARVEASTHAFAVGSTSDVFTVQGEQARAGTPTSLFIRAWRTMPRARSRARSPRAGRRSRLVCNAIVRGGKVETPSTTTIPSRFRRGSSPSPAATWSARSSARPAYGSDDRDAGRFNSSEPKRVGRNVVNEFRLTGTYPGQTETFDFAERNRRPNSVSQV